MVTKFKPWKIGIMGGTFDPIHYGHLVTAEIVRGEFSIDRVLFVPSGLPPHKDPRLVSHMEHRYLMTVFATLTNPYFEVSRVDIDRGRETYTIDTLRDLRMLYGEQVDLYFITGVGSRHCRDHGLEGCGRACAAGGVCGCHPSRLPV